MATNKHTFIPSMTHRVRKNKQNYAHTHTRVRLPSRALAVYEGSAAPVECAVSLGNNTAALHKNFKRSCQMFYRCFKGLQPPGVPSGGGSVSNSSTNAHNKHRTGEPDTFLQIVSCYKCTEDAVFVSHIVLQSHLQATGCRSTSVIIQTVIRALMRITDCGLCGLKIEGEPSDELLN